MYASGNGSEKQRLLTLVESQSKLELEQDSVSVTSNTTSHSALEGHVVLDLYTGIGYFSVPLLARLDRSLLSRMLLCEWNLDALEALRRSLQANGVAPDRYEIYPGVHRGRSCYPIPCFVNRFHILWFPAHLTFNRR